MSHGHATIASTNAQLLDDFEVARHPHVEALLCSHAPRSPLVEHTQRWPLIPRLLLPVWQATVYVDTPTVPCVQHGTFTIHQYLEPPITFAICSSIPVPPSGELQSDGEVPPAPALTSRLECLLSRKIVVPVPGLGLPCASAHGLVVPQRAPRRARSDGLEQRANLHHTTWRAL